MSLLLHIISLSQSVSELTLHLAYIAVVYGYSDEAPALATFSLLPVLAKVCTHHFSSCFTA